MVIGGAKNKPLVLDIYYNNLVPQPAIIYMHGFNGFKDWGNFDLIAEQFAESNFTFIKFNGSHNGTTTGQPEVFADPEAYGQNNYTIELTDLQNVIDWTIDDNNPHSAAIDKEKIFLIGHSRGGGIALIKALEEPAIRAIITWASVAECKTPWGSWSDERIALWEKTGVEYYINSRTREKLPIYYQLYQDYQNNKDRLDLKNKLHQLKIPLLICHGSLDEVVPVEKAYQLHSRAQKAELFILESDHVFGRKHPWTENKLPRPMQEVVSRSILFLNSILKSNS